MDVNITGRQRKYILFIGIYAVLSAILFAVVYLTDMPSSVCDGYFPYADAMANGIFPYTEEVWAYDEWRTWEYPPMAYLFLFIPRMFAPSVAGYQVAFIVMTGLFFILGLWCSERLADRMGHDRLRIMALYSVLMFLMFEFLTDRFDMIPMILTFLALILAMDRKYTWAFVVLAFATTVKLYPAIFFPILAIYMLAKGERMGALKGVAAFIITGLAVLALFYLCGADPLSFTKYHTDRPLEMESVIASLIEFTALLGLTDVSYGFDFGSDNIYGSLPDIFSGLMLPLMAVVLVLLYAHYAYWTLRSGLDKSKLRPDTCLVLTIAMMTFILVSTVFSGQYMVWLIPFVLLLYVIPGKREEKDTMMKLFVIGEVLTQLDFLVNFGFRGEGEAMSALGILILLTRNIMMVVLYLGLTMRLIENDRGKLFRRKAKAPE